MTADSPSRAWILPGRSRDASVCSASDLSGRLPEAGASSSWGAILCVEDIKMKHTHTYKQHKTRWNRQSSRDEFFLPPGSFDLRWCVAKGGETCPKSPEGDDRQAQSEDPPPKKTLRNTSELLVCVSISGRNLLEN